MTDLFAKIFVTDPANWRAALLTIILRAGIVLGVIVYIPSVVLALRGGLVGVVVIDTLAIALLALLAFFERVPFSTRATVFCLVVYMLGAGLLIWIGSVSQIFLLAFSVLSALLLGLRAGLGATVLSTLTLLLIGLLGFASPEMRVAPLASGMAGWITITLNFALVNTLLTVAIGVVISAMDSALLQEISARSSFERQRTLLRTLIDAMPDLVFTKHTDGRFDLVNHAAYTMFGLEREEQMTGKTVFDLYPSDIAERRTADDRAVFAGRTLHNHEEQRTNAAGKARWFLATKLPLRDARDRIVGLIGISRDITDRKQAELQRDRFQSELQQSQKMEAIGQLAGGIAHDFNNLLTIIAGHSGLLLAQPDAAPGVKESVREIADAAERAAGLTRQLLAFSRQAMLQPEVIDVNATVLETSALLRRLIGEDIALTTVLDPQVAAVRVDPNQLNQILMNLALNARDAMPRGGKLTIGTANVTLDDAYVATHLGAKAGAHVMLSITDSGTGMSPDVLSRIFEPFYTTKGVGKGTGLGLSMVFGIVQQSGGGIHVYSEPNHGSTFKIYLPAVQELVVAVTSSRAEVSHGGTETILLVEDDDGVRALALRCLQAVGYEVITARDGVEALAIAKQTNQRIDLLVTDVVMPNMSGPKLVESLRSQYSDLAALYMSGYTDDAVVRHGLLQADVDFLQKPFTALSLAQKVRAVLDRAVPPRA